MLLSANTALQVSAYLKFVGKQNEFYTFDECVSC